MTLPHERMRSIKYAEEFLCSLLFPNKTPRVPKKIREKAHRILRHYPSAFEVDWYWKEGR